MGKLNIYGQYCCSFNFEDQTIFRKKITITPRRQVGTLTSQKKTFPAIILLNRSRKMRWKLAYNTSGSFSPFPVKGNFDKTCILTVINEVHVHVYSLAFVLYYTHRKGGSIRHTHTHTYTHCVTPTSFTPHIQSQRCL